jgi:hypothetical protein
MRTESIIACHVGPSGSPPIPHGTARIGHSTYDPGDGTPIIDKVETAGDSIPNDQRARNAITDATQHSSMVVPGKRAVAS